MIGTAALALSFGLLGGWFPGPAGAPGETNCRVISSIGYTDFETKQILQCDTRTSSGVIVPNTHTKERMIFTPTAERRA